MTPFTLAIAGLTNYFFLMQQEVKAEFKEHESSLNKESHLVGRFCSRPFRLLEIHKEFYAFPCCPSWLPVIVGNCQKTSIEEVWNNEKMQEVRRSIHDGSFKYCDHLECPEIQANRLPCKEDVLEYKKVIAQQSVVLDGPPSEIALCYDETCNLACPSCRTRKIQFSEGPEFDTRMAFTDQILTMLDQYGSTHPILLRVTGSGDPIASPIFYRLLKALDIRKHSQLTICLQTNGTMLTEKVWGSLVNIQSAIESITVSIDAATEATYAKVRKFGNWSQLRKNLTFLAELRKNKSLQYLHLNFVVQKENYKEVALFVKMAQELEYIDEVFFSFVNDWGTWNPKDYTDQCIWKQDHPEFNEFIEILKAEELSDYRVNLGNLTEYRNLALRSL